MADVRPHTPELLGSLGSLLGTVDAALGGFSHPAAARDLKWDPRRAGWIVDYTRFVEDPARRSLAERLFAFANVELARLAPALRASVIYNDANDYNVLVDGQDPYARRVTSVVDFGDMLHTWTANEVAVACAYAMLDKPDPLAAAAPIVAGYHAAHPLTPEEIEAIFPLVCSRLAVSVVNSAYQRHAEPGNAYLTVSERPAWDLLERLGGRAPQVRALHVSRRLRTRTVPGFARCGVVAAGQRWRHRAAARPRSANGPACRVRPGRRQPRRGDASGVVGQRALRQEDCAAHRRCRRRRRDRVL